MADFPMTFWNAFSCEKGFIKISRKFIPSDLTGNTSTFVQVMAWQATTWTNVDWDVWNYMVSQGHNDLTECSIPYYASFFPNCRLFSSCSVFSIITSTHQKAGLLRFFSRASFSTCGPPSATKLARRSMTSRVSGSSGGETRRHPMRTLRSHSPRQHKDTNKK